MSKKITSLQARSLAKLSPDTISKLPSPVVREGELELDELAKSRKRHLTKLTRKKIEKEKGFFRKQGRFMTSNAMKRSILRYLDRISMTHPNFNFYDGEDGLSELMNLVLNSITPDNLRGQSVSQLRYLITNNTSRRDDLITMYDTGLTGDHNVFDRPGRPEVPGRYPSQAQRYQEMSSLGGFLDRQGGNKKKPSKKKTSKKKHLTKKSSK